MNHSYCPVALSLVSSPFARLILRARLLPSRLVPRKPARQEPRPPAGAFGGKGDGGNGSGTLPAVPVRPSGSGRGKCIPGWGGQPSSQGRRAPRPIDRKKETADKDSYPGR